MSTGMDNIEHVVVVMMENRSMDNLLGFLYADEGNRPPHVLPVDSSPNYNGLVRGEYCNTSPETNPQTICVSEPTTTGPGQSNPFLVPDPDPGESFDDMTQQIYGTSSGGCDNGGSGNMSGFLQNYAQVAGAENAWQIMQSYSNQQVGVISQLARSFAVSDQWHASAPCQTWPNRGFMHTGSSDGHINNDYYEPYDITTIFNVMQAQKISWSVFSDIPVAIFSLTYLQFLPKLIFHPGNFHLFSTFQTLCASPTNAHPLNKLPSYSFLEPKFQPIEGIPNDYHPPHNVCRGEQYLAQVYNAVRTSPYRDKILLVVTFDEHGGCYDHVPPPTGAAAPEPGPVSRDGTFDFCRFGVRIPTILVSSYVQPGTVFRSGGDTPFDHTSILATLRDWKSMDNNPRHPFLPSPRIQAAPTIDPVLTLSEGNKNTNWPDIQANCTPGTDDENMDRPVNDLHHSLVVGLANQLNDNKYIGKEAVEKLRNSIKTYQDAADYFKQAVEKFIPYK